ncbi:MULTISPECIES: hypothetical protein [Phaeobacter]|uniref:Uncharacterized protein n=1 Tax=Phaeobacter piscinae TaxID=1580596 RepID=A0AAN1LA43_9RHOB|nr:MULTISPECIES: hypothetical protein [Phaeobacter]ATG35399.1 hypothetical protein PhaeoP36_01248 [Phaeobacter piscinae]ATG43202.1 hypothetical protein PhaeoP13_01256 [Phaeobacter piscinae]AUQ74573.1 hypothetical protein PhaeoP71_01710 [Phaeobacter piscinae]AUQ85919.1 hypothetical protein PhaeoP42_01248 [Phaeobacter piscinae]AUR23803.1 hypothetical protein PhaeoP23_01248 [Phaeobacter piscinae]
MQRSLALLLVGAVALSGCGFRDSRVNPLNWFGGSDEVEVVETSGEPVNPLIPVQNRVSVFARPDAVDETVLVQSVTDMRVERTPTGAIVYATGIAARQGAYGVELRLDEADRDARTRDATLDFTFRAIYPDTRTALGSERTRTLRAAVSLSQQQLASVRSIRVVAAQNARESRR